MLKSRNGLYEIPSAALLPDTPYACCLAAHLAYDAQSVHAQITLKIMEDRCTMWQTFCTCVASAPLQHHSLRQLRQASHERYIRGRKHALPQALRDTRYQAPPDRFDSPSCSAPRRSQPQRDGSHP